MLATTIQHSNTTPHHHNGEARNTPTKPAHHDTGTTPTPRHQTPGVLPQDPTVCPMISAPNPHPGGPATFVDTPPPAPSTGTAGTHHQRQAPGDKHLGDNLPPWTPAGAGTGQFSGAP